MTLRYRKHLDGVMYPVRLAWRKQQPDVRDKIFLVPGGLLPTAVDLRSGLSPVEDQGNLGSCTANMLAGMVEAAELKRTKSKLEQIAAPFRGLFSLSAAELEAAKPKVTVTGVTQADDGSISFSVKVIPAPLPVPPAPPTPSPAPAVFIDVSRLFSYYVTRDIEGTASEDSGATIRDTLKGGNKYGVCDEKLYPYNVNLYAQKPPQSVYDAAAKYKITAYHSIADGDLTTMKAAINDGYLVGFGFTVYSYFMSQEMATNAMLCLPKSTEFIEGGHAVALCGYDDNKLMPDGSKGAFLVRNSWGTGWGLQGYFWISYKYVANTQLCNDFWVITTSPI